MLEALDAREDSTERVREVGLVAAAIGRGIPADQSTDDAVEHLHQRFASHPWGPVAVLSMLYQNHDATAALVVETLDATIRGQNRRSAVTKTVRVATRATRIGDIDIPAGASVTINLAKTGFEFGAGAHQCPGRELAQAITAGIVRAVTASGYSARTQGVESVEAGRPTTMPMEPRP